MRPRPGRASHAASGPQAAPPPHVPRRGGDARAGRWWWGGGGGGRGLAAGWGGRRPSTQDSRTRKLQQTPNSKPCRGPLHRRAPDQDRSVRPAWWLSGRYRRPAAELSAVASGKFQFFSARKREKRGLVVVWPPFGHQPRSLRPLQAAGSSFCSPPVREGKSNQSNTGAASGEG